ncbi:uncharacterized protein BCR38DRAFT_234028 [Pseudomassariella vexata]|uniref:Uncharacterized protein n=1 Tax=Pseudomassariella vexata TaxID=1141098 RepID=A0A1Y2DSD5_9PEZI|nr:uncharacterized protein BCR38DRAFT_234028 [Pseudomassariella vexata]ORY62170.1 hypothetical protein BCR38DRAFT_234028 [Pseudomassariella vexata]
MVMSMHSLLTVLNIDIDRPYHSTRYSEKLILGKFPEICHSAMKSSSRGVRPTPDRIPYHRIILPVPWLPQIDPAGKRHTEKAPDMDSYRTCVTLGAETNTQGIHRYTESSFVPRGVRGYLHVRLSVLPCLGRLVHQRGFNMMTSAHRCR